MRAPLFTFKQKKENKIKNKNNLLHVQIKIPVGCQIFCHIHRIEIAWLPSVSITGLDGYRPIACKTSSSLSKKGKNGMEIVLTQKS
jgi:hypothetical protein